jgi:hypothetical protein
MKTGNRSKSASSASLRSDKALAREEALSESKDIEHHFEELSLEYCMCSSYLNAKLT